MNENEQKRGEAERTDDAAKKKGLEGRQRAFQILAGGYLLYLAYQLLSGAVQESGWTTIKIVSVIAGVVFAAAGAATLFFNLRAELRRARLLSGQEEKRQDMPEDKNEEDDGQ